MPKMLKLIAHYAYLFYITSLNGKEKSSSHRVTITNIPPLQIIGKNSDTVFSQVNCILMLLLLLYAITHFHNEFQRFKRCVPVVLLFTFWQLVIWDKERGSFLLRILFSP